MGLEELGSFIEGAALPVDELLSFDSGVLAELGDLFEDDLLGLELEVFAQFDVLRPRT